MSNETKNIETLQRNLQVKIQKYLDLQREVEYYQSVLDNTTLLLSEILRTKKILQEIVKGEKKSIEGLINLGVGIFSPGTIEFSEKVLVDIGASTGVWMKLSDALSRLEKHEEKIKETANRTKANLTEITNLMSQLQVEIEQLRTYIDRLSRQK
ncbi:MAG: prefoldin subunit alpha [Candidatus Njordarchaeia archaeon]